MRTITYSYKANPAKYETEQIGMTLEVPDGVKASDALACVRACVHTAQGMRVSTSDKRIANRVLKFLSDGEEKLSDFAP